MAGHRRKDTLSALPSSAGDYEVGYGKPPKHSRFQPGQSGNPRGRPRGSKNRQDVIGLERLKKIVLEEAYREVTVADGSGTVRVPVAQAVVRTMAVKAAKGDHRSQRLFSEMLWEIEGDQLADNRDKLMTAVYYKELGHQELVRRRRDGLPAPLMLPHPDDVIVDMATGEVRVMGPVTRDQYLQWELAWDEQTQYEELVQDVKERLAATRNRKQKGALSSMLGRLEGTLRSINKMLPPESYERWSARYPSSGEFVEIVVHR